MKLIAKTVGTVVKLCAVCVLVNHLAYLDWKTGELEREVTKLKEERKG